MSNNSFGAKKKISVKGKDYTIYSIADASKAMGIDLTKLPCSMKVLLENMLRYEDGRSVTKEDVQAVADWVKTKTSDKEIAYRPARVLLQDFTGVPAVVDLAAMRDAVAKRGLDPKAINPLSQVDLVIDHSVQVDSYATKSSFKENVELEFERNAERYEFLRWGQGAFTNFRVVPPGTGICHQVNLEYLSQVVWSSKVDGELVAYPDTLVGTDSHTTMVNGLAVLGWGVGGIEAEAAMLGQPISMLIPEVVGFKLTGSLKEGTTATDLVLTVTQMLRKKGVVGKFVEFYGSGLANLPLADRATIANMAPEYGATCGFFPIDEETLAYLRLSARDENLIALVEAYAKEQGLWRDENPEPVFTDVLELDLGSVEPSLAGPKRPQDRVTLATVAPSAEEAIKGMLKEGQDRKARYKVPSSDFEVGHADVVIAAITSCTNTSNPSVMLGAGLVARNAAAKGLTVKPWVKTSLAPGSQVVTEYLQKAGLDKELEKMGFHTVGYGCTTCIGNSGPLKDNITQAISENDLAVASVLSGNRNFEGRVHPLVKLNYLASPLLVVAYAIAGTTDINLQKDPIGVGSDGKPVYLKDIWPSNKEIQEVVASCVTPKMFKEKYGDVFSGDALWQKVGSTSKGGAKSALTYGWQNKSTYIQNPPYFNEKEMGEPALRDLKGARILGLFGDSITTDHISPAGNISKTSPAAKYLEENGVERNDFNSYGARRGNHEVMIRGTFANIRIKNEMLQGIEGGVTKHLPSHEQMSIFDAAMRYKKDSVPTIVVAGKEYGTGSSRDWAAKGTRLLGVAAVIAESFERIHRSNLVGMGVLPLTFKPGESRKTLGLDGTEVIDLIGMSNGLKPGMDIRMVITLASGIKRETVLKCRLDTLDEVEYFKSGGILQYVVNNIAGLAKAA
jgi:aconitate hydratase